jgi:hypothetical protein
MPMMNRMRVNSIAALLLIVLLTLSACGREETNSTSPGENAAKAAKADGKNLTKSDDAPRVVDPSKDGY